MLESSNYKYCREVKLLTKRYYHNQPIMLLMGKKPKVYCVEHGAGREERTSPWSILSSIKVLHLHSESQFWVKALWHHHTILLFCFVLFFILISIIWQHGKWTLRDACLKCFPFKQAFASAVVWFYLLSACFGSFLFLSAPCGLRHLALQHIACCKCFQQFLFICTPIFWKWFWTADFLEGKVDHKFFQ